MAACHVHRGRGIEPIWPSAVKRDRTIMYRVTKRWPVVLGMGLLLAAEPVPPQPPVVAPNPVVQPGKIPATEQGPQLGELSLPAPRPLPTGTPVEEPAPAPREVSGAPGTM